MADGDVVAVRRAEVNGLDIAYETFGDPSHPAVVLVMGLGTQMLAWPDDFCAALADAGHHVVRFDNRDVGLSTHLRDVEPPGILSMLFRRKRAPYTVADMADDLVGLLDSLGLASADLVGASMGGFIAQTVAIRRPDRVRSLTLIMTSTGSRRVGRAKLRLVLHLLRRRPVEDREGAIKAGLETTELIGSPGFAMDEDHVRELAARSYDRSYDPDGYRRQLAAVSAQPDRTEQLRELQMPTVVVHGLHDPLVDASGGLAVARAIPYAKLVGWWGMGHSLPRPLWPALVREITEVSVRGRGEAAPEATSSEARTHLASRTERSA